MSDKLQKNQLVLAFTEEGRSEAPKASQRRVPAIAANGSLAEAARGIGGGRHGGGLATGRGIGRDAYRSGLGDPGAGV